MLKGIPAGPLRDDAFHTIMEFVGIYESISSPTPVSGDHSEIIIRASGEECDTFANEFLKSKMPIFRGLAYKRTDLRPKP
jgi:hypothetical protein